MKKEVFAVVLLVLIFLLSLYNAKVLADLTEDLSQMASDASKMASDGDWEGAVKKAETAIQKWHNADWHTHVTLRHFEIDAATDAFYSFLEKLHTRDSDGKDSALLKLNAHLDGIRRMERISPGSIF